VEKEVLRSPPWDPVIVLMGMVPGCTRGGLGWTLGNISSLRGWETLEQAS